MLGDQNGCEPRICPDPQNRNAPRQRTRHATPGRAAATGKSKLAMSSFLSPFLRRWLYCPGVLLTKFFVTCSALELAFPLLESYITAGLPQAPLPSLAIIHA